MATALITGASGGIGYELAMLHAEERHHLVLIARNENRLMELKAEWESRYKIVVTTIALDLSQPHAAQTIYDRTEELNIQIDYLINNAGFGDFGLFHQSNWDKAERMIQLNITSLVHLCKLYLPQMVSRKKGRILNIASTAAFQPGPTMAVYYASKAFVLSFSEAIGNEVKEDGVTVTAFCPGATASGFQAAAAMEESALVKGRRLPSAKSVARHGFRAMMQGKSVSIPGTMNWIMANAVRFIPRNWVVKIARKVQDKVQ